MNPPASGGTREPPRTWTRLLASLGPGLIVAGSIVGSGELIATTKTGAEAGFSFLWLILLGCVVKVFTQIELGRYAVLSGKSTLAALDEVPGPRIRSRGNWLIWLWLVMWCASMSQQGGIVGGVGQALAISFPITSAGVAANEAADSRQRALIEIRTGPNDADSLSPDIASGPPVDTGDPPDVILWAAIVTVLTSVLLFNGRYGMIQSFVTALVASFTVLTVINLVLLQSDVDYRVTWAEFTGGLKFGFPEAVGGASPIITALATFGIIGVGAGELVAYPYWCLEKGYVGFIGEPDGSEAWRRRASGWLRVLKFDAWGSMVVYTFATVAFYLLGAAVLHRVGLNPQRSEMVRTLAVMFVPVFSNWAAALFLFGAIAVLYSTLFVVCASHARVFSDALRVMGLIDPGEANRERWVRGLSAAFPFLALVIYVAFPAPAQLVLLSGVAQGIMLPLLAGSALFFRYRRAVDGLTPGKIWDVMLWLSATAMLITGGWTIYAAITG